MSAVHWLGQPLPAGLEGKALFPWPDAPLMALFSLQALLRAIQSGAADLLVLGQSTPGGAAALLLGSPAAVGRWNLPPLARLDPLALHAATADAFVSELAAQAAAHLEGAKAVPEEAVEPLALAAISGIEQSSLMAAFPGAARLAFDGLPAAARLARELVKNRTHFALLAGFAERGGLGLWIERI